MEEKNKIMYKEAKKLKRKKTLRKIYENRALYMLLIPACLMIFVFKYIPMYGIQISFRNFNFADGVLGSEWVGLKWFKYFFNSVYFWRVVKNTLTISLYGLMMFPVPIILALLLHNITGTKFKRAAQTITYLPHFISMVVVVGMLTSFTSLNSGWINTLIEALGGERINFMAEPGWYPHLYIWSNVWQEAGWGSIIYLAALTGISPELHDAAKIDGATKLQRIWYIDMAGIVPTIVIMLIMRCGTIMSIGFDKSFLMQNNLNLEVAEVFSTYAYKMGIESARYSYSAAVSLISNIINITLLTIVNRFGKKISGSSLW